MKNSEDYLDNWIVQVRKGFLELCVLNALDAQRERYGYELVKSLVNMPGLGVTEGTIYPLLSRLKKQGLVTTRLEESVSGPVRKYYSLTKQGKKVAEMMNEHVGLIVEASKSLRGKGGTA